MIRPWTDMVDWPTPTKGSTMAEVDDQPMCAVEDTRTPAEKRADAAFEAASPRLAHEALAGVEESHTSPLEREAIASVKLDGETFSVDDTADVVDYPDGDERDLPRAAKFELEEPPIGKPAKAKRVTGRKTTAGIWAVYKGTTPTNSVAGHLHADELSALREVAESKGTLGMVLVPWGQSLSETLAAAAE